MSPLPHRAAPEQNFLRKVLGVTSDGVLMHFRLACGHLITEHKNDVAKQPPGYVECWACREEKNQQG